MKKKLPALLPVAVFLTMVFGFSLWNLLRPARSFSENENRALAQLPQFSLESLFAGTFTSDYEEYLTDQFPLRDEWISLKTRAELLLGKKDVNNVYFGKAWGIHPLRRRPAGGGPCAGHAGTHCQRRAYQPAAPLRL